MTFDQLDVGQFFVSANGAAGKRHVYRKATGNAFTGSSLRDQYPPLPVAHPTEYEVIRVIPG